MNGSAHPWDVELPYDLRPRAARAIADEQLQRLVNQATLLKDRTRRQACAAAFGERYDAMRRLAAEVRQHALDHLDFYLQQFVDRATAAGARVHFALDADEANAVCTEIPGSPDHQIIRRIRVYRNSAAMKPSMSSAFTAPSPFMSARLRSHCGY